MVDKIIYCLTFAFYPQKRNPLLHAKKKETFANRPKERREWKQFPQEAVMAVLKLEKEVLWISKDLQFLYSSSIKWAASVLRLGEQRV
jgi:hypothetical protein